MSAKHSAPAPTPILAPILASFFVFAIAPFILGSCSGAVDVLVRNDSSARVAVRLEVPAVLSQRVRQFGQIPATAPLFDSASVRKEFGVRKTIHLIDVAVPDDDSMTSVLWVPDLKAFADDKSLAPSGLLGYTAIPASGDAPALRELRVRLSRQNAVAAFSLFPGLDGRLVESLSPPALEKDPVSALEYRMNLETVIIGKKSMPAFDACNVEMTFTAPRSIIASGGGTAAGQTFKVRIPIFDLLTLEKPVEFWMRWAE
ncbi:MAG: hypothetical protein WBH97_09055 [Rectinemataceae bacterium]